MTAATLPRPTRSELVLAPPALAGPKLRIAYLTAEYPKVSHTFIRREISELTRRGHDIFRVSIRPPGPLVDPADQDEARLTLACLNRPRWELMSHALKWAVTRPWRWVAAVRQAHRMYRVSERGMVRHLAYLTEAAFLAHKLKAKNIGHVHVHFGTNAAAVARLLKTLSGITYSMTVHGPGEFDSPVGLSLGDKVADATFTAAISHFGKAQLCRWVEPSHWDRIHVIRCTIDPKFLAPPTPVRPDADRLVCVGRLTAQKAPLPLVEAFASHVRSGGAGHLVFAGDGELRTLVEEAIRRNGIGDRVTITGWLSEAGVRQEMQNARVIVLPSSAEGLPVVLMEALAVGRPVVSTFTAGIPELVRPGENGWLVPAGDPDALATVLCDVMATPANRLTEMGMAGRGLVECQHHPVIEGEKLERLFHRYLPS